VAQLLKQSENERFFTGRKIKLISSKEFNQSAPGRLREQATLSEHDRHLARLEFELEQRKELADKLAMKKSQGTRLENLKNSKKFKKSSKFSKKKSKFSKKKVQNFRKKSANFRKKVPNFRKKIKIFEKNQIFRKNSNFSKIKK